MFFYALLYFTFSQCIVTSARTNAMCMNKIKFDLTKVDKNEKEKTKFIYSSILCIFISLKDTLLFNNHCYSGIRINFGSSTLHYYHRHGEAFHIFILPMR